jgi:hypothetical protein
MAGEAGAEEVPTCPNKIGVLGNGRCLDDKVESEGVGARSELLFMVTVWLEVEAVNWE